MYYLPNIKLKFRYTVTALVAVTVFFLISCSGKNKSDIDFAYDPEVIPSMSTDSVDMLITSDSGIVKYRLITQTWNMYDKAKEPYWLFPDGLYAEQYDSLMQIEATLEADSVWNYKNQKLWKLKGNVVVKNIAGETFKTQELYWDERKEKVYSNVYTEMHRPGKSVLYGHKGFEGNQNMTEIFFFKATGQATITEKEIEEE